MTQKNSFCAFLNITSNKKLLDKQLYTLRVVSHIFFLNCFC